MPVITSRTIAASTTVFAIGPTESVSIQNKADQPKLPSHSIGCVPLSKVTGMTPFPETSPTVGRMPTKEHRLDGAEEKQRCVKHYSEKPYEQMIDPPVCSGFHQ